VKFFIHPGYGKTATTTLQKNLYGKHNEIASIGRPWTHKTQAFSSYIKDVNCSDYSVSKARKMLDDLLCDVDEDVVVFSDENLHSNQFKICTISNRLSELLPNAQIVFTIRNQVSIIESYFSDTGRILKNVPAPYNNRLLSMDSWLKWAWLNWDDSFLGLVDYYKYIKVYGDSFGIENVHVLLFEDFSESTNDFVVILSNILGVDSEEAVLLCSSKHENMQISRNLSVYQELRRFIFPGRGLSNILPFGNAAQNLLHQVINRGVARPKDRLSEQWINRLSEKYKEGNALLVRDLGLDLSKYDYPL